MSGKFIEIIHKLFISEKNKVYVHNRTMYMSGKAIKQRYIKYAHLNIKVTMKVLAHQRGFANMRS